MAAPGERDHAFSTVPPPPAQASVPGMIPQPYPVQQGTQPPVVIYNSYPSYGYHRGLPLTRQTWQLYGVACHMYCVIACGIFGIFFIIVGTINLVMLGTINQDPFGDGDSSGLPFIAIGPLFLCIGGILVITAIVVGCKGKKRFREFQERLRNDPNALATGHPSVFSVGSGMGMNPAYPTPGYPGQPGMYQGYPGTTPVILGQPGMNQGYPGPTMGPPGMNQYPATSGTPGMNLNEYHRETNTSEPGMKI